MSATKKQKRSLSSLQCKRQQKFDNSRFLTLEALPPEVLEMIIRFLPLHDVSSIIRLVSRKFSTVASTVLNSAFLAAGIRLEEVMHHLEAMIWYKVTTEIDLLAYSKAFNVFELIRAQYKMLKAVTWRYTHPPRKGEFPRLCFYAGSLLDDLNRIICNGKVNPSALATLLGPDASVTSFIALCKRFMNFFEKVSERKINRSALISGCKTVDVLDCLAEGRQVLSFRASSGRGSRSNIVTMKLKYVMKRAWFTCLEIPSAADENSWRDEQRFMYLRLRRLVGSVNEHHFEKCHYDRELMLQAPPMPMPRAPPASTYSGYGEYGGQFFYYGNMNKYAYENKFKYMDEGNEREDEETVQEINPCFDLVIVVELRCSPELAPLAVRAILKSDDIENIANGNSQNPELYLKLHVTCPVSVSNRLPGTFIWELRSPRWGKNSS